MADSAASGASRAEAIPSPGRPRCVVLDDYQDAARCFGDWAVLADRLELQILHRHCETEGELVAALAGASVVVVMRERTPFPARLFARLPQLRLLVTTGRKNASIDLAAAASAGVTVCGTGSAHGGTIELTWAMILGFARHIPVENTHFRTGGPWQSTVGIDLHGKRLGILGLGHIGAGVARVGAAFGMTVQAWSANLTPERCASAGVLHAPSLEALLATSDVVTIHLLLSPRTRGLIGRAQLQAMKPSAFLVNTSRGPIVDEAAAVEALRARRIRGYAVDVFDREPLAADHPLRGLDNVLGTPHIGYVTEDTYRAYFRDVVANIAAWLDGRAVVPLTP